MDDLRFIASAHSVKELAKILGQVATAMLNWRKSNVVTYDLAKTKAVLFSGSHWQRLNLLIAEIDLKLGTEKIKFNKETTCLVDVWLDSQFKFNVHINKKFQKA